MPELSSSLMRSVAPIASASARCFGCWSAANWEDFGELLGQTVRFPTPQREQLSRLATIDAVLRWNCQQLAIPEHDNDLYYDLHTTHHTGSQNILKGWRAAIRWSN